MVKLESEVNKIVRDRSSWISDTIIDKAQQLIKQQHPQLQGLHDPLLRSLPTIDHISSQHPPEARNFVQILNVNSNHWVCVSGTQKHIFIYDSLGVNLDQVTLHKIALVMQQKESKEIKLTRPAVQ